MASVIDPLSVPHGGFIADLLAEGKLVTGEAMECQKALAIKSVRVSPQSVRDIAFSAIQTTGEMPVVPPAYSSVSNDSYIDREDTDTQVNPANVGVIEVQMLYAEAQRKTIAPQIWTPSAANPTAMNERSKKAGFNVTTYVR